MNTIPNERDTVHVSNKCVMMGPLRMSHECVMMSTLHTQYQWDTNWIDAIYINFRWMRHFVHIRSIRHDGHTLYWIWIWMRHEEDIWMRNIYIYLFVMMGTLYIEFECVMRRTLHLSWGGHYIHLNASWGGHYIHEEDITLWTLHSWGGHYIHEEDITL